MDFENIKRMWKHRSNDFFVELVNWKHDIKDVEHWNIYVYVYPSHKWYQNNAQLLIDTKKYHSLDDISTPPFHGGITSMIIHPGSIQLGCDYGHLYDDFYAIETDPYTFEPDVNCLIKWFDDYNINGKIQIEKVKAPSNNGGQTVSFDDLYSQVEREAVL